MLNTKTIGNKITEARKKMNLSQTELAQRLFISPQAVGKWERGESMPDIITFNRLAEILGTDLNYFSENLSSAASETPSPEYQDNTEKKQANILGEQGKQILTDFSGKNLPESDFTDVIAHKEKFEGSVLHRADFSRADLTGSLFKSSDMRKAQFVSTNLTDCKFYTNNLEDANFYQSLLVRTDFSKSWLVGAKFTDIELIDVKISFTDLRKTIFKNCSFQGVDFKSSDLSNLCLDGQTFISVKLGEASLDKVSLKGSTLKNVSFTPPFSLSGKYFKTIRTIQFDGASMDKLSYNALKGMGADLSTVSIL